MAKANPMKGYDKFLKRKMMLSRIVGIFCCLLAIGSVVTYYLKTINEWLSIITIAYCVATIFTANSFLQDIKVGNPWQRMNGFCSVIIYLLTAFLIVWGFVHGHLTTQF